MRIPASAGVAGVGDVVIAENASVVVCGRQRRHRFDLRPTLTTQLLASIKGADVHIVDDGPDARGDSDDDNGANSDNGANNNGGRPAAVDADDALRRASVGPTVLAIAAVSVVAAALRVFGPLTSSCSTSWRWS